MSNIEGKQNGITFFIPAYNCEKTILASVESIMGSNFHECDELIVVNDGSTDETPIIVERIREKYPITKIIAHQENRGGAAARNTATKNARNSILFCLDSDNILEPGSIYPLKKFMLDNKADIACFQEFRFFIKNPVKISHNKWILKPGIYSLADYLAGPVSPGASGNYMFTKESWVRAGGYPEFAGALDTWGFGLRQVATSSKMMVLPNSFYYHRIGNDSYWVRFTRSTNASNLALEILTPFFGLIDKESTDYILSEKGRNEWFERLEDHPIKVIGQEIGTSGWYHRDNNLLVRELRRIKSKVASLIRGYKAN